MNIPALIQGSKIQRIARDFKNTKYKFVYLNKTVGISNNSDIVDFVQTATKIAGKKRNITPQSRFISIADQKGVPFVSLDSTYFNSQYVNESTNKILNVFENAKSLARESGKNRVIIFIKNIENLVENSTRSMEANKNISTLLKATDDIAEYPSRDIKITLLGSVDKAVDLEDAFTRRFLNTKVKTPIVERLRFLYNQIRGTK